MGPEDFVFQGRAPIEVSADLRAAARGFREIFLSLVAEDFTEAQALVIIGHMIAGAMDK